MAKFFTPSRLSENIAETPEGFLLCLNVPVARTGWQDYGPGETPLEPGDDGKVWIYRDPQEVFRPQTIASFQAKSVTIKHPEEFVVPENWKELTFGTAQNIRRGTEKDEDGEWPLLSDLLITDEIAIGLVKKGLREVSCGYDAEYEETAKGEGRQFNIIGNHIALVERGRAGEGYAIKDHKREENMDLKSLMEQIKNLGKTVDAAAAKEAETAEALSAKKKKTKDAEEAAKKEKEGKDAPSYDDLVKAVKDLGEKVEKMGKSDDEDEEESEEESEDDSENETEGEILSRVKALEAAVAKMLKGKSDDEDEEESEDDEESEDESEESDMSGDEDESEESEDEEGEEGEESQKKEKKTGDAARIEILTPGKKFEGKNARMKCLTAFAKTEDGAKVLKQLGMKKPVLDAKSNIDMIFMAASTIMKSKRGVGLKGTKDGSKWEDAGDNTAEPMTAEKLNEINAKAYGQAK